MAITGTDLERTALVAYGTETGNAQDVAEDLGRNLERLHFVTNVTGLDNIIVVCRIQCMLPPTY